jgi:hypothetical protein
VGIERLLLNDTLNALALTLTGLDSDPGAERKARCNREGNHPGSCRACAFADCPDGHESGDWKQKRQNDRKMNYRGVKWIGQHMFSFWLRSQAANRMTRFVSGVCRFRIRHLPDAVLITGI